MYIVVLMTAKNKSEAEKIATALVSEKLIACANIVDNVQSVFSWQGKLDAAGESLVVMKTQKKLFQKLKIRIKLLHSYDVPEIIALPIVDGDKSYLNWVKESTS